MSEVITITETKLFAYRITISEVTTISESIVREIFGRIRGVIGIIKEFVRIGDRKEKVVIGNIGVEGVREELNDPYLQYNDISVMYDQENICYNNFIRSEKPKFVLGKKFNPISVSLQKDKPMISKK